MDLNRWKVFRSLDPAVSAQVKLAFTWGKNISALPCIIIVIIVTFILLTLIFTGNARAAFLVMENDDVFCVGQDNSGILGGYKKAKSPLKIEELCGQGVIGNIG